MSYIQTIWYHTCPSSVILRQAKTSYAICLWHVCGPAQALHFLSPSSSPSVLSCHLPVSCLHGTWEVGLQASPWSGKVKSGVTSLMSHWRHGFQQFTSEIERRRHFINGPGLQVRKRSESCSLQVYWRLLKHTVKRPIMWLNVEDRRLSERGQSCRCGSWSRCVGLGDVSH